MSGTPALAYTPLPVETLPFCRRKHYGELLKPLPNASFTAIAMPYPQPTVAPECLTPPGGGDERSLLEAVESTWS